jgi:hypothetical protein
MRGGGGRCAVWMSRRTRGEPGLRGLYGTIVGPPMVARLLGVRPLRPASAVRGTFSLSMRIFSTDCARKDPPPPPPPRLGVVFTCCCVYVYVCRVSDGCVRARGARDLRWGLLGVGGTGCGRKGKPKSVV